MPEKFKIWFLYFTLFITGAVILVIEIAGTRVLAPFYGSTIFVWSSLITVTLAALAAGYVTGGFIADKRPDGRWFYALIFAGGASALALIKISQPVLIFSDQFGIRWGAFVAALALFALPLFLLSTTGPFVIRLLAREREHAGHVSGIVFGVSTAGSLAGALLAGFYLIPNFFIENIFIAAASIVMGAAFVGFLLERGSRTLASIFAVLLLLGVVIPAYPGTVADGTSVLHESPSFYGTIQIIERGGIRCMSISSFTQTCIKISNSQQVLPYVGLIETLLSDLENGRMLVIGLGGGVMARDMAGQFDAIDVVEIDQKVYDAAKEYFGYRDADPSITTHIADGRAFVRKYDAEPYTAVVLDIFAGSNLVPHFFTKEAFESMREVLAPNGVLVINTIGRPYGRGSELPRSVLRTLAAVFPYTGIISTENIKEDPEKFGNLIFVASASPKEFPVNQEFAVVYDKNEIADAALLTDARNLTKALRLSVYEEAQQFHRNFLGTL
ncbi:MAG: fused MFS/spermidine synthase [Candidatus Niyogibacteria bacterium]|nr:fused MFS/spermidine synthase [Candidatus Niyogibacteria bacterium]